jgi:DNA-binding MarR family transcriptional regulator
VDGATGLSPARLSALSVLVFMGPLSMSALADAEQVTTATMSRVVDGLESASLVTREPNPDDRRGVQVRATVRGSRLLHRARQRRVEGLATRLVVLSGDELRLLGRAAGLMERALGG